jgi:hypothetical protein
LPLIKFNFGRFSQLAMLELILGVARLDDFWPFPWLPLVRLLSAGVLMRRREVVVFIGLELDTFSSRTYDSFSRLQFTEHFNLSCSHRSRAALELRAFECNLFACRRYSRSLVRLRELIRVISRQFPLRSTATSRLYRPCRSSLSSIRTRLPSSLALRRDKTA